MFLQWADCSHVYACIAVRSIVWNLSIRAGLRVLASAADSSNYKTHIMHPFVAFVKPGLFLQIVLRGSLLSMFNR